MNDIPNYQKCPSEIQGKLIPNKIYLSKYTHQPLKFIRYEGNAIVVTNEYGNDIFLQNKNQLKECLDPAKHLIHGGIYRTDDIHRNSDGIFIFYNLRNAIGKEYPVFTNTKKTCVVNIDINKAKDLTLIEKPTSYVETPKCVIDFINAKEKQSITEPNKIKPHELKLNQKYRIVYGGHNKQEKEVEFTGWDTGQIYQCCFRDKNHKRLNLSIDAIERSIRKYIDPIKDLIHGATYQADHATIKFYIVDNKPFFTQPTFIPKNNNETIINIDINKVDKLILLQKPNGIVDIPNCITEFQNKIIPNKIIIEGVPNTITLIPNEPTDSISLDKSIALSSNKFPNKLTIKDLVPDEIYISHNGTKPQKVRFLYSDESNFLYFQTEQNKIKNVNIYFIRKYITNPNHIFIHGCKYRLNNDIVKYYNTDDGPKFTKVDFNQNETPFNVDVNDMQNLQFITKSTSQDIPICLQNIKTETKSEEKTNTLKNVGIATTVFLTLTYFINKLLGN